MIHSSRATLLSGYRPVEGVYDELCSAPDILRPYWNPTFDQFEQIGLEELSRLHRESERLLRENGVTYNVYDDPKGAWRTWSFDPVPLLIPDDQWRPLEAGLVERGELWNEVLRDLYGPRRLIETGVIPISVVDGDHRYLRACRHLHAADAPILNFAATDVARRPDGTFVVIEDWTQAPSGSGYALENRIFSSRLFPDIYRQAPVHRLAAYFRNVLASLTISAPDDADEPRIVLLSPGAGNETYFEHSYLAHYLGINLVVGSDLVVRNRMVWLRTLDGLERVHVIIRRVDESYLDPLELRSDSVLGIPGLLTAIRAGTVVVSNPPGTGICESLALRAFLPRISQALLGRDLQLPSARSFWCGHADDRGHVLANLDQMVVSAISTPGRFQPIWPGRLKNEERAALVRRIEAKGSRYAARELVPLSTAPTLADSRIEPRGMVLRTFMMQSAGTYVVMPGGLTRVGAGAGRSNIASQEGGTSKDTWVLSPMPSRFVTLLPNDGRTVELRRSGGEIASRVAESLFWLGRNGERAEGSGRLLRSVVHRLLETRRSENDCCPPGLLTTVTNVTMTHPGFSLDDSLIQQPDDEIRSVLMDATRAGSLAWTIGHLQRTAQSARDRLSDDMWRIVNTLKDEIEQVHRLADAGEILESIIVNLSAFAGLVSDSMTRGPGYWFVDAGRRIERGTNTSNLIRSMFLLSGAFDDSMAEAILDVTDSVMTYRRRYLSRLHPAAILDLLLNDRLNPRSVAFQLFRLQDLLHDRPSRLEHSALPLAQQTIVRALGVLATTDTDAATQTQMDADVREMLLASFASLDLEFRKVSDLISSAYFTQAELPRQLVQYL